MPTGRLFGTTADNQQLDDALRTVQDFIARTGRVPFVGEYGAYEEFRSSSACSITRRSPPPSPRSACRAAPGVIHQYLSPAPQRHRLEQPDPRRHLDDHDPAIEDAVYGEWRAPAPLLRSPSPGPTRASSCSAAGPGAVSLATGRYYAHPQNQFWRLIGAVIGRDLAPLAYAARLRALLDARIGLWDTVAAATRKGSLDADIRLHRASDLAAFASTLPDLRAVAFNGAISAQDRPPARRPACGLDLVDLPSSSPAYASLAFERKRDAWQVLRSYL